MKNRAIQIEVWIRRILESPAVPVDDKEWVKVVSGKFNRERRITELEEDKIERIHDLYI